MHQKSIFAFLDPNDADKTTMTKLLFGLLKPTRGTFQGALIPSQ